MRMPRVRFTIGGLMIAVLVAGVVLRGVSVRLAIREQQAQANYQQAKLLREVAEYALKEYKEGVYAQEKATYLGQIALAKSDVERAIDRVAWSSNMQAKGLLVRSSYISDQLAKQSADFDLERAQMQLEVLEKYTKQKQIKSLQADLAKALADEQAKLADYRMEQAGRWRILGF